MPVEENMYDDKQLAQMRFKQEDPFVMYFIVRKELNMSAGKIAAQCGHAAQMIIIKYFEFEKKIKEISEDNFNKVMNCKLWMEQSFRKVVLVAKDKDWEKIKEQIHCVIVRDAGLTEVEPGSETVIATWPMKKSQVPKIIKRLQVLK